MLRAKISWKTKQMAFNRCLAHSYTQKIHHQIDERERQWYSFVYQKNKKPKVNWRTQMDSCLCVCALIVILTDIIILFYDYMPFFRFITIFPHWHIRTRLQFTVFNVFRFCCFLSLSLSFIHKFPFWTWNVSALCKWLSEPLEEFST